MKLKPLLEEDLKSAFKSLAQLEVTDYAINALIREVNGNPWNVDTTYTISLSLKDPLYTADPLSGS